MTVATTKAAMAYEQTRKKPEDASPMAERPTFRNRLADFASRAISAFLRFFGFRGPDRVIDHRHGTVVTRRVVQTPPRAFGKAGRKLARKLQKARRSA